MSEESKWIEAWQTLHDRGYFRFHPHYLGLPLDDGAAVRELMQIGLDATDTVLDVGCGYGRVSIPLAAYVHEVIGIDLHKNPIKMATQLAALKGVSNVSFLLCDGFTFPLPDGSVDVVFSLNTMQHLRRETAKRYIAETWRVMRPRGRAYHQFLSAPSGAEDITTSRITEQSIGWTDTEVIDAVSEIAEGFGVSHDPEGTSIILTMTKGIRT